MRYPTLAVLIAAILVLPACGGGGESDEDQVRSTVQQLVDNDADVCGKLTSKFSKQRFDGKRSECEKAAKESKLDAKITKVSVNGDKATAAIKDEDNDTTTVALVKDGDWKIDGAKVDAGSNNASRGSSGSSGSSGSQQASTGSQNSEQVKARGAVDALLAAIRQGDSNVFCGLLDEKFARQLLRTKEFGVAKCVQIFTKNPQLLQRVRRSLGDDTTVKNVLPLQTKDKKTGAIQKRLAIVSLTNGSAITLHAEGSRYVVDRISD